MKVPGKHEVRCDASKELVKQMLNRVAYAPTMLEYDVATEELRSYKAPLATRVQENDPQHWAMAKVGKEQWGRIKNNPVES